MKPIELSQILLIKISLVSFRLPPALSSWCFTLSFYESRLEILDSANVEQIQASSSESEQASQFIPMSTGDFLLRKHKVLLHVYTQASSPLDMKG